MFADMMFSRKVNIVSRFCSNPQIREQFLSYSIKNVFTKYRTDRKVLVKYRNSIKKYRKRVFYFKMFTTITIKSVKEFKQKYPGHGTTTEKNPRKPGKNSPNKITSLIELRIYFVCTLMYRKCP